MGGINYFIDAVGLGSFFLDLTKNPMRVCSPFSNFVDNGKRTG